MKDAALRYLDGLQDFVCIQLLRRSNQGPGIFKHWDFLETQERELTYVSRQERFTILKINGRPPREEKIRQGYFLPGREFASALADIFDPKSAAEFEWDHDEQSGGSNVCIFGYRVTSADNPLVLYANGATIHLTHHGFVYAGCETGLPLRIRLESEPAFLSSNGSKIALGYNIDIRYAMTPIVGKGFLLPQTAEEIVRFANTRTKVESRFERYRRYQSDSTLTFEQEKDRR